MLNVDGLLLMGFSIVFVHGHNGNEFEWPTQASKTSNIFWPRDFLPSDLPHTRIMSYGYAAESNYLGLTSPKLHINELSIDLVECLTLRREITNTKGRPIVFVAHSLGGLVIKNAFLLSKKSSNPDRQNLIHSLVGICFFDTPSFHSHPADRRSIVDKFMHGQGYTPEALPSILRLILRNFDVMLKKLAQESNLIPEIAYFDSSNRRIQYDHLDITEFSSATDPDYLTVSRALQKLVGAIQNPQDAQECVVDLTIILCPDTELW